jgi:hypothetical protein
MAAGRQQLHAGAVQSRRPESVQYIRHPPPGSFCAAPVWKARMAASPPAGAQLPALAGPARTRQQQAQAGMSRLGQQCRGSAWCCNCQCRCSRTKKDGYY